MVNAQCSRCKSIIDISFFGLNRKKEPYKTCDNCRNKNKKKSIPTCCNNDSGSTRDTNTNVDERQHIILSDADNSSNSSSSRIPVIVFDVEHSGCGDAYILQLSWGLYNNDGSLIKMRDYYLRPESEIYINPRASFVHGITYDTLLTKPNTLPINELLSEFVNDVLMCDVLVAHNINVDIKTVNRELSRHNIDILNVNSYCTMVKTKTYCNAKDVRGRLKNPRIDELHCKLFGEPNDAKQAHNSCYDVEICAKCYFQYISMLNNGL